MPRFTQNFALFSSSASVSTNCSASDASIGTARRLNKTAPRNVAVSVSSLLFFITTTKLHDPVRALRGAIEEVFASSEVT
jgi:hypothetical protein